MTNVTHYIHEVFDRALLHHQAGEFDLAEAEYRKILAKDPGNAQALHLLGLLNCQRGEFTLGAALLHRAAANDPNDPICRNNGGSALQQLGRLEEAAEAYRAAVSLDGNFAVAHNNLGAVLQRLGRSDEAENAYRSALRADSGNASAHCNLGALLAGQGRFEQAIDCYQRALVVSPSDAVAADNLGSALKAVGRTEQAIAAFRRALQIDPTYRIAQHNLLLSLYLSPGCDAAAICREHVQWGSTHANQAGAVDHINDRSPQRRLRIGYISADFREHPVSRNFLPLILNHDRDKFEIVCYSASTKSDAVTQQIRAAAADWHSIEQLSDSDAAGLIRSHSIDILVDLQLHGVATRIEVFAHKPAPVQASLIAYPGTSGLRALDYRFSDPRLDPPGVSESFYTEELVRLEDHALWCYAADENEPDVIDAAPAASNGFVTFGSLCDPCKNSAVSIDLWSQVLSRLPESRFMLLVGEREAHSRYFEQQFKQRGVDPARLIMVARQPRRDYMKLYNRIDVVLDTLPYNGHITTFDALWMGCPVVTLEGQTAVGRGGSSILHRMKQGDRVAKSAEQFVAIATELGGGAIELGKNRRAVRELMRGSPLCDARGYARSIEDKFRWMWRRWRQSVPS